MAAPLDGGEDEKPAGVFNDSQILIEPKEENGEPGGKKEKGANGFMVSVDGELMAASSTVLEVADELGPSILHTESFHLRQYQTLHYRSYCYHSCHRVRRCSRHGQPCHRAVLDAAQRLQLFRLGLDSRQFHVRCADFSVRKSLPYLIQGH